MNIEERDVVRQSYNFLACSMMLLGFVFGKMADSWWWIDGLLVVFAIQVLRLVYSLGKYNG